MIYIFHGTDVYKSSKLLEETLVKSGLKNILRLDEKSADHISINGFLNTVSMFEDKKALVISNAFSIIKSKLEKIIPIISTSDHLIILFHPKKATATQLKSFPKAQVFESKIADFIFLCAYSIKPGNINQFLSFYQKAIDQNAFELLLYLIKNNLRKQLATYSKFNPDTLKKSYLSILEMEYQYKSGQLSIDKEIALERVLTQLILAWFFMYY